MKQRSYQRDVLDTWSAPSRSGKGRLACLPTGLGKGPTQVWHAQRTCAETGKPFLSVQPNIDLLLQAVARYEEAGFQVFVEQGQSRERADRIGQAAKMLSRPVVVVATAQSLSRHQRLKRFPHDLFGGVHIEEAHHSASDSYGRIMRHFSALITGDTATPFVDGLGDLWEMAYNDITFVGAVEDGWLTPPRFRMIEMDGWDYGTLRASNHELTEHQLSRMFGKSEKRADELVSALSAKLSDELSGKTCFAFFPTTSSAKLAAQRLRDRGVLARHMTGVQSESASIDDLRRARIEMIAEIATGALQVLCLVGLGREGVDVSTLASVAMVRPFIGGLFPTQIIGRACRPHGSIAHLLTDELGAAGRRALIESSPKPQALVLIFNGAATPQHLKLWTPATLVGGESRPRDNGAGLSLADVREQVAADAEEIRRRGSELQKARHAESLVGELWSRVTEYSLHEFRDVVHDETISKGTAEKWQSRVEPYAKSRPTEAQLSVLAHVAGTQAFAYAHRKARLADLDKYAATNAARAAADKRSAAILRIAPSWSRGGAYREYSDMCKNLQRQFWTGDLPAWPK